MDISFDRISLKRLRSFDKPWCEKMFPSYTSTTTSMTDNPKIMDKAITFTVVLMALLGGTLFNAGLLRLFLGRHTLHLRLFLGRYNIYVLARILLHSTLVLFLPLQSYVFSQAQQRGLETELLLTLLWMLLVELVRKRVQVMVLPTDGSSFSRGIGRFTLTDYSDEATRLVWIGYLIYSNMPKPDKSATLVTMFVILWSLSVVKLVQRVANCWLAGRSLQTAMNPLLIAGYMQHLVDEEEAEEEHHGSAAAAADMSKCKYVVMGEEKLVVVKKDARRLKLVTTLHYGYGVGKHVIADQNEGKRVPYCDQNEQKHFHLLVDRDKINGLVTVEKIWGFAVDRKHDALFAGKRRQRLENLCLSFSLFKMLRRRFEQYPMAEAGSKMARKLMLEGLLALEGDDADKAHRPFQVLRLELDFLENYYQAPVPVVMSQPILFFSNFAWSVLFVLIYLATILLILIINDEVPFLYCSALGWGRNPKNLTYIDLFVTFSLVITLVAVEATEFFTLYMFSNWNIVRYVCLYDQCGTLRRLFISNLIAVFFWVLGVLQFLVKFLLGRADTDIKINQVSIVNSCGPIDKFSARASNVKLPPKTKADIVKNLKSVDLNTGNISLPLMSSGNHILRKTSTEIILAFHLATELFGIKHHVKPHKKSQDGDQTVATRLSRYCMYLVAHMPNLLPDDEMWACGRYEDMRSCLEQASRKLSGSGTACTPSHCCTVKMLGIRDMKEEELQDATTVDAVKLFRELEKRPLEADVWTELADFWIKLLIYLAPSNDVQGHAKALASSGGDLITYLWAFCTHAGITRRPRQQHEVPGVEPLAAV